MAGTRELDPKLFAVYVDRYRQTPRAERGCVMDEMCGIFGLSRGAMYKRVSTVLSSGEVSVFDIAAGRQKRSMTDRQKNDRDRRFQVSKKIAAIKVAGAQGKHGYPVSTEMAMHIAVNEEYLTPDELPADRSPIDRWLQEFGFTFRDFKKEKSAVSFVALYPNEVWLVDATPLNRYFMDVKGTVKAQYIIPGDTHLEEILAREGLSKIWVYYVVDMFSKAFYLRAYASKGENTHGYMDVLTRAMLPKDGYIMEGVPEILYSDMGSSLTSGDMSNFLLRLECRTEAHFPGNPRAKGRVEGRIGAFKRSFEPALNLLGDRLNSLDRLNEYFYLWSKKKNLADGNFQRFYQGSLEHPIRRCSMKNITDATTRGVKRKLTAYGCVSVKWSSKEESQEYYVNGPDLAKGDELFIYRNMRGQIAAQDSKGRIYQCDDRGRKQVRFGDYRPMDGRERGGLTEDDRAREDVIVEAAAIRRSVNFHSLLPDTSNIHVFPARGEQMETVSPIAPETFETADDAKNYLVLTTGVSLADLPEKLVNAIEVSIDSFLSAQGVIPKTFIMELQGILRSHDERRRALES